MRASRQAHAEHERHPRGASQAYGNPGALTSGAAQLLSNLVDVRRSYGPVIVNHYNVAPVFDVYSNVDRRDLGSVGREVEAIIAEEKTNLPRGTTLALRGQVSWLVCAKICIPEEAPVALSIPVVVAGAVADHAGLGTVTLGYVVGVAALVGVALVLARRAEDRSVERVQPLG